MGHATAAVDPATQNEPAGHGSSMPPTQKLPAGHVLAVPLRHRLPVGHATHSQPLSRDEGFSLRISPARQRQACDQSDAPPGQAQWSGLEEPASEYRPAGHAPIWLPRGRREGPFAKSAAPEGFDWNMWQGPTPEVDYVRERTHVTFRYWWDYSGGTMTDWGAHHNDIALQRISNVIYNRLDRR